MNSESVSVECQSCAGRLQGTEKSSLWPHSIQRLWSSIAEFPLSVFALVATAIGVLVALRYLALIEYPLLEISALVSTAGLIALVAAVVLLVLAGGLCAPAIFFHGDSKFQPRAWDLFVAQVFPISVLTAFFWTIDTMTSTHWSNLLATWVLGLGAAGLLLFSMKVVPRWRVANAARRKGYAWRLAACAFFSTAAANGIVSLMSLAGFAKNELSTLIFLVLLYVVAGVTARLLTQGVRHVFIGMLVISAAVLTIGSFINGEFARTLAASAGIRFRNPVEVLASAETCARVQQLALHASVKSETEDWSEVECRDTGTRMDVDVQVRAGGRWLIQPITLRGIKVPSTTKRLSVPDAGLELVLPSLPKKRGE